MVLKPFQADSLEGLCSQDQLDLLNSIDSLRSQGISHYVSLPQIIVCGDQSSGKSSVLEAISGVSFPTKSTLCTRFPTELVLRKSHQFSVSISIVPDQNRPHSEQASLAKFQASLDGFEGLSDLIEEAKVAMGILPHGKAFSRDILRVEVSGPDRPHLTIVDLPGLIHSETKRQSASDVNLVQELVQSYMNERRSIILAVVSAKNDYANQIVLRLARSADRSGFRTLGIITKPDVLLENSGSESTFISLARNQDVVFRLGWHVLKNMDSEAGPSTLEMRNEKERMFFSQGSWQDLPESMLGIEKLRSRLSKVLLGQIATELPGLIDEIEAKITDCHAKVDKLGEPRTSLAEQHSYLVRIAQRFQSLVQAAADGTYNDPAFGDAESEDGGAKRLRAVLQNSNIEFARELRESGHYRKIVADEDDCDRQGPVITVTREAFLDHVQILMDRTKGRELPGTFNPLIISQLFSEQCAPWGKIAQNHVQQIWEVTRTFLNLMATEIADEGTAKSLFHKVLEPALTESLAQLKKRAHELVTWNQRGHPISYRSDLRDAVQRIRNERESVNYSNVLEEYFGLPMIDNTRRSFQFSVKELRDRLLDQHRMSVERSDCSEALDYMQAYYEIALDRFIDTFAIQVIEETLLFRLLEIFSPTGVMAMDHTLITAVAGESEQDREHRQQLRKQLDILNMGLETCRRYVGDKTLGSDQTGNRVRVRNGKAMEPDTHNDDQLHRPGTAEGEHAKKSSDDPTSELDLVEQEDDVCSLSDEKEMHKMEGPVKYEPFEAAATPPNEEDIPSLDEWSPRPSGIKKKGKKKTSLRT